MKHYYILEDTSKYLRLDLLSHFNSNSNSRFKKKSIIWTLNRSPHGNKTSREQFGLDIWQLRLVLDNDQLLFLLNNNKYLKIKESIFYSNMDNK